MEFAGEAAVTAIGLIAHGFFGLSVCLFVSFDVKVARDPSCRDADVAEFLLHACYLVV